MVEALADDLGVGALALSQFCSVSLNGNTAIKESEHGTKAQRRVPSGGNPRHGILGLDIARGDRLFITLLGAAFIFLGWLGLVGTPLWGGLVISLAWGGFVFRWA